MMKILKNPIYIFLTVFIVLGFIFRLKGISSDHSFWSDEAYIASLARDFYNGNMSFSALLSAPGSTYQILYVLLLSFMFNIFGTTEFAARIPSIFFGTVTILLTYLITSKFSNRYGALISAFLATFAQVMLVYSTMAKPYILLTAFLLGIIYLIQIAEDKKGRNKLFLHGLILFLCIVSVYIQFSSILYLLLYLTYITMRYSKEIITVVMKYKISSIIIFLATVAIFFFFKIYTLPAYLIEVGNGTNNTTYLRELFARQYLFLTIPALFGFLLAYKKSKALLISITVWLFALLLGWNFVQYSHNVRYIVPLFAILFVFAGIFWGSVITQFFKEKSLVLCLLFMMILYAGGYKIARKPSVYYNPNQDLIGDVQNADYKETFAQLKNKYSNVQDLAIFNDVIDAQRWYLPEKPDADAYFMRDVTTPRKHVFNQKPIYGTLEEFLIVQNQYPKGILIVEDWHSFLPEDIKEYAKKNMKSEIRVEGLPQANGDNWPLEVYSWGMDDKK